MTGSGFSVIEILVVVGIIGLLVIVSYPSIINSQETRALENTARDIMTTMQWAKFQAVKTKLNHRVGFALETGGWVFFIQKEDHPNEWNSLPGHLRKTISTKFYVNVNLPNQAVVFSPLGLVSDFSTAQNSITIQSPKLKQYDQADQRSVNVFAGGSVESVKSWS